MFRLRFISFVSLIAIMPLLGCPINKGENKLVRQLDAILLTADDLPTTMALDVSASFPIGGQRREQSVVDGFSQTWVGTQPKERIAVNYWLFQSVADAQKAAELWQGPITPQGIYQPEPNADDVIGDATWRIPNRASIWFVKNNVLVFILATRKPFDQLTFTRTVARKIETKINAVLEKK